MDDQRADQDGGDRIAGNTECHHRNQGAAGDRVVGRFGGSDPFDGTAAEGLAILRGFAGVVVGDERCNRPARPWQDAEERSGQRTDGHRPTDRLEIGETRQHRGQSRLAAAEAAAAAEVVDKLGYGKQADHRGEEMDTAEQVGLAEGETGCSHDRILADGDDGKPDRRRQQPLDQRLGGEAADHRQPEEQECEHVLAAEQQGDVGERRSNEIEAEEAE